ncbi:MAG: sodium-dependent transporter, partial [Thermoanaerobaculia bacterium]
KVTRVLMPILFAILGILCLAATRLAGFEEALRFLFNAGPISRDAILEAVGHSFFTLSLGMGAMITYGSYISRKVSIRRDAALVCALDTLIGLMACVVMFSIIFSVPEGLRAAAFSKSATILFTTLPRMLFELPAGALLAPVFYLLVSFAALTSTISLLEVVVSYFIDQRAWSRKRATLVLGGSIFVAGIPVALSLGASPALSGWAPFGQRNAGIFGVLDYFASNWMLPVGGFFIALFTGWFLSDRLTRRELETGAGPFRLHGLWKFLLRVFCPLVIAWIIAAVIGGKAFN